MIAWMLVLDNSMMYINNKRPSLEKVILNNTKLIYMYIFIFKCLV